MVLVTAAAYFFVPFGASIVRHVGAVISYGSYVRVYRNFALECPLK